MGNMTKPKLRRAPGEGDISESDVGMFYDAVREFFETSYSYCYLWMTLYIREANSLTSQIGEKFLSMN